MVNADWWKRHNNGWEHFSEFNSLLANLSLLSLSELYCFGSNPRKIGKDEFMEQHFLSFVTDRMNFMENHQGKIFDREIKNYLEEIKTGYCTHNHFSLIIPYWGYWNQQGDDLIFDNAAPTMHAILNTRKAPEKILKNIPSGDASYFLNFEGKTVLIVVDGVSTFFSHENLEKKGVTNIDALVANILTEEYPKSEGFQKGFKMGTMTATDIILDMNEFLYSYFLQHYQIDLREKTSGGEFANRYKIPGAAACVLLMDVDNDRLDMANVGDTFFAAFPYNNKLSPLICTPNPNHIWDIVTTEVMEYLMSTGLTYGQARTHPLFLEWIKLSYNSKPQYGCDLINGAPFEIVQEEKNNIIQEKIDEPIQYQSIYSRQCKLSSVKKIAMGSDGGILPGADISTPEGQDQLYATACLARTIGLPMWFLAIQRMLENDPSKIHLSRERMGLDDQTLAIIEPNSPFAYNDSANVGFNDYLEDYKWAEGMWQWIQGDLMTFPYKLRSTRPNPISMLRQQRDDLFQAYQGKEETLARELFKSVILKVYA